MLKKIQEQRGAQSLLKKMVVRKTLLTATMLLSSAASHAAILNYTFQSNGFESTDRTLLEAITGNNNNRHPSTKK